jgi:IS30 family transposase
MSKKHSQYNTHLTLDDRKNIEKGIENRATKVAIAKVIGKDPTTVAKEIRMHRWLKTRNLKMFPVDCKKLKKCRNSCRVKCENYEKLSCKYRDRSPGACNNCSKTYSCPMDKYYYDAEKAFKAYRYTLVDSREGVNMTTSQRDDLAAIIDPLIQQGQSPYQIRLSHPEINICERSIYNYIDLGLFKSKNIDLKEKVKRKEFKNKYKKRKEPANYQGRTYLDYIAFCKDNPELKAFEMDTIYNSPAGPYIQTIMLSSGIMIGFIHKEKTDESMAASFDYLQDTLGDEVFNELFSLGLTDRGTEFQKHTLFEFNKKTGEARLNLFYCDPMCSYQKPHVENNHNFLRDILPNNMDLSHITNEDLNLLFSHINSTPRRSLGGKSPYEVFTFIYPSGKEILLSLGIAEISSDDIILKPYLLKKK